MTDILKSIFQCKIENISIFMKINDILGEPPLVKKMKRYSRTLLVDEEDYDVLYQSYDLKQHTNRRYIMGLVYSFVEYEDSTFGFMTHEVDTGYPSWKNVDLQILRDFLDDYHSMDEIMFKLTHSDSILFKWAKDTQIFPREPNLSIEEYLDECNQYKSLLEKYLKKISS